MTDLRRKLVPRFVQGFESIGKFLSASALIDRCLATLTLAEMSDDLLLQFRVVQRAINDSCQIIRRWAAGTA